MFGICTVDADVVSEPNFEVPVFVALVVSESTAAISETHEHNKHCAVNDVAASKFGMVCMANHPTPPATLWISEISAAVQGTDGICVVCSV